MLRLILLIVASAMLLASFGSPIAVSRQLTNIVGKEDGRRPLYRFGKELGLTPDEIAHITAAMGYVNCGNDQEWMSAFLVAPNVVVTVAHVFRDVNGKPTNSVEKCFFEPQGKGFGSRYYFSSKSGDFLIGDMSPRSAAGRNRDFAVGRLQQAVAGGMSLAVQLNPRAMTDLENLLPITAFRTVEYIGPNDLASEPLGQLCNHRRWFSGDGAQPSVFYSDCDNTVGGSGSPVLQRTRGNSLMVVGMFVGGGMARDFTEYSEGPGPKSLALSLGLDGDLLRAILTLR